MSRDSGCLKNSLDFWPTNVCVAASPRDGNTHVQPLDSSQLPTLYTNVSDLPTSIFSSLISSVALNYPSHPFTFSSATGTHARTFTYTQNKFVCPFSFVSLHVTQGQMLVLISC
jgi:hypothetical protein